MLVLLLSIFLASDNIISPVYKSLPFPQPPEELPEKWQCTLEAVIIESGPCFPAATIKYCYEVDRVFVDYYRPVNIGQDKVCLPYKREEVNQREDEPAPGE